MSLTGKLRITRFTRTFAATVFTVAAFAVLPAVSQPNRLRADASGWAPETFKLANDMRVVVLPDHRAPVVTHMLWYRVGSADEFRGGSGLAHFLEHLMFKATETRAAGEYSKIVARNGGEDNASTFYDYTEYHFRVAKDRLPEMMRLEADRMVNLQLSEEEVAPELSVVREERRQTVESSPAAVLDEKVFAEMFAGHPYASPVIGQMADLEKLTRANAVNWYHTWYGPENAILVVAGDMTAAELKPIAEEIYGAVPARKTLRVRAWPEVKPLAKPMWVTHSDPKVRQAEWSRHWLGVKIGDKDSEALQVGMQILAGGRTSRLYGELNEQGKAVMGHGYSIEMEAGGMLTISVQPSAGVSIDEIRDAAMAITAKFLREGPTSEEVKRAKNTIAADAVFTRDNQMEMAQWYGQLLTAGQSIADIEGRDERISDVTIRDVMRAMNRYMAGVNFVDAVLLPEAH